MKRTRVFLFVCCSVLAQQAMAGPPKDPRLKPITRDQIFAIARGVPARSELHMMIIDRASRSGLLEAACEAYSTEAAEHPRDWACALNKGVAALTWADHLGFYDVERSNTTMKEAEQALVAAYKFAPLEPSVLRAYGFYLW